MREIEIEWVQLGIRVTATLAEGANGALAELLWQHLPYRSIQNHALVSGHHLYHLCPIRELVVTPADFKADRRGAPDGTLFLSHLQHLAVKYGPLTEPLDAAPVGSVVPAHVPLLREAGRRCWEGVYRTKRVVEVRVTRRGAPWTGAELPAPPRATAPAVAALVEAIHAETARVWTVPPAEVVDLHAGRIGSRAGSYDQYFATLVFVNGETRPLGYNALGALLKAAESPDVPVAALAVMLPQLVRVPAEFLGYCGLHTLWDFCRRAAELAPQLGSRDDFRALVSTLALYVNRLNGWNLHYFPWHHGEHYPFGAHQALGGGPGPRHDAAD